MKNLTQKTKKIMILCIIAVVLIIAAVLVIRGIRSLLDKGPDTSQGVEYIKQKESGNISEIEAKINSLDQQESKGDDDRSLKEKFAGSVVIGDSIAEGFTVYDVLNSTSVVSKIGVHLNQLKDLITQVKSLEPATVFLAIGTNDVIETNGDTSAFISEYKSVIEQLQKEIPGVNIFVNSIFPVQQSATEKNPALADVPQYNNVLKKMCDTLDIGYIDNSDLIQDQYYEEDGTHFKADFYPIWGEHMAEVAAL